MELFTLGADRGAYTEHDVRELARALTGFDFEWSDELGMYDFRYVPARHDDGNKTVFGKTGPWTWQQGLSMCIRHPLHPSFFVTKLWSYFIPAPPSAARPPGARVAVRLERLPGAARARGDPAAPEPPHRAAHGEAAGGPHSGAAARLLQRGIDSESWTWLAENAGQRLFYPPDVSGWDDSRWLDTSTIRGRCDVVAHAVEDRVLDGAAVDDYDATETPGAAVAAARAWAGNPNLTAETVGVLTNFAANAVAGAAGWQQSTYRGLRQNALRHLILSSPDYQTS